MSNWVDFEVFVKVLECGSFTGAAKAMGVSKSYVSRRVSCLEERLGVQLLVRNTRRIRPTDLGLVINERCRNLFTELSEIENHALDFDLEPRGQLRIVAADLIGEYCVSPVVTQLASKHSDLDLELYVSGRQHNLSELGYDVAIQYGDLEDSRLRATRIGYLPHITAASPAYLDKRGVPKKPDDLRKHDCLVATFEACAAWQFQEDGALSDFALNGSLRSNNGAVLITGALNDLGIVRLPSIYLEKFIKSDQLVEILADYQAPAMPVWAVLPDGKYTPMKTRLFIDAMRSHLATTDSVSFSLFP